MKFNQNGQAAVEYILLLIVVVAIGQAVWQMNRAFRDWAQNYYVAYFECLLETGELPGLGGEVEGGICNESYQPFSWETGRPPTDATTAANNGSGSGSNSGSGSSSSSGSTSTAENAPDPTRFKAGGGGSSGGSSRRVGSTFPANNKGSGGGTASSIKGKEKKSYTGSDQVSTPGSLGNDDGPSSSNVGFRSSSRIKSSYFDEERGQERSPLRKSSISKSDKKKKDELIRVNRKTASKDVSEPDTDISFGMYLRYLIIAAIIIALVLLIGGQFLQVNKEL